MRTSYTRGLQRHCCREETEKAKAHLGFKLAKDLKGDKSF